MNDAIHAALKLGFKEYKAKGAESFIAAAFAVGRAADYYGLSDADGAALSLYAYTIDWAWSSGRLSTEAEIALRDVKPAAFARLVASLQGAAPNDVLSSLRAALTTQKRIAHQNGY